EQYDHMVQTNNALWPGGSAAVIRIKGSDLGIAVTTDGNGRHCYLDPRRGARALVAEAARNISCVGATPVAVTNCLNFGNPEKGEIAWQFKEAVEGMGEACQALGTPVTGGNVSFYNESFGQAIYPNPVVGMMGIIDDVRAIRDHAFKDEGDVILLVGGGAPAVDGSEYQLVVHGEVAGRIPDVDLDMENKLQRLVRAAILEGKAKSAHDVSSGGIACCLAEGAIAGGTGATVAIESGQRADLLLFGEAPGLVVMTVAPADVEDLIENGEVPARQIGRVGGSAISITVNSSELVSLPVAEAAGTWGTALEKIMAH
ncbi:MAG: AIR synthase related protein, partial [Thermoleophilia bacterium]